MTSKLHIQNWITVADPDFYTMFIKAWIPLNAWYFVEYNTNQDTKALKELKTTKNKIRNRIEVLLKGQDLDSIRFRSNIANLQKELKDRTILNYGNRVSFESIKLDEYFPVVATECKDNIIYKAIPHKTNGFRILVVAKNNTKTYMDKVFNPHSLSDLELDNQFIGLPNKEMKIIVRKLFKEIDPTNSFSLICLKKSNSIILDESLKIYFKDDTELIAKSLLQILYELRCLLFHGIIDPNTTNMSIYEYAYGIVRTLIKEIK